MTMADIPPLLALPDDCLALILERVTTEHQHEQELESVSLVCKPLLAITNGLRHSLTIKSPMLIRKILPRLLCRFFKLKRIIIKDYVEDLDNLMVHIAKFGLEIESLDINEGEGEGFPLWGLQELGFKTKIKNLRLRQFRNVRDRDLVFLGQCCPYLEDLNLSYVTGRITPAGIKMLSKNLRNIQKLDLSGLPVTDTCLVALSTNCMSLREIHVNYCRSLTPRGVASTIQNSRENLRCLSFDGNFPGHRSQDLLVLESFIYARNLYDIRLHHLRTSDQLLEILATARLPLKKLSIFNCSGITAHGILKMLCNYRSIECLTLTNFLDFLSDDHIIALSKLLPELKSIDLSFCNNLTGLSFHGLIENCHLLKEINMSSTKIHGVKSIVTDSEVKSCEVEDQNKIMGHIGKFSPTCPRLELLNLNSCNLVSEKDIVSILRSCTEIRYLDISYCAQITNFDLDFDVPKLEAINARVSGLNDKMLTTIARRCPRLLHLDLKRCHNLTTEGMRQVLNHCRALRMINVHGCSSVDADIVIKMAWSIKSLRSIISSVDVSQKTRKHLFRRHGCLLSNLDR